MSEEKIGQHYLAALHQAFPGVVLDEAWQTKDQLTITVKVNYLPEVVEFLYYQQGGWLSVLFGNDERKLNGHYAVYYVLSMEQGTKCWITVRVEVDANKPEYPSVTPRVPAAVWGEREVRDMYGLVPVGLPDERRLVLPDDWPDELYPLRKDSMDYRQRPAPTTDAETYEFINELGSKKNNVVPIGPLHVTSDEPGHFRLFVDGENIIDADYRLFYVHRGMEKLAETRMGYNEVTFLSDRVCGICGFAHSTAYTTSVENAMGIVVPERAQMIRAILLEVERLHSHLLNLGLACHFTGFDSGFMQFFRVRETSMKMAEILTDAETYEFINELGSKKNNVVPIGPLHVTSDEPGHFRLFVDGENIIDADYRLFYVHRGMEKLAETRMGYNEVTFLSDRVCGICGFAHSTAYTTSVENAMGIVVPERAQMIRAILLEVERLHSHLLNLGLACHFTGFDSGFMQFFRVRETSMKMAEILTGARKTYGLNLIGGIRRDLLKEDMIQTRQLAQQMRRDVQELVDMLLSTPNMEQRTVGIGRLDPEIARDFSNVGPMVRASGHARDTRADHPFVGYGLLPMEVHSEQGCDVISRLKVRINEVYTALNMIDFGLDNLPGGPLMVEGFTYIPHRFALGFSEAPRGDDIHWSMTGDNQKLYRWRCRAATYANWPTLRYMLRGNTVSDAPLIIGSLDPCYSCTDRMTVVDVRKKKSKVVPYKELERYSIERKNSPLK
ncbi:NADH-quinone oxidoreductase subunit C [Klebsiella pneumoniae]|nr:hydrogenase large subunit [Klebsiella pneumoniae]MCD8665086.1 NADH-quinone oxidoreductase subunit C [Klebsiella pneumoniae]